MCTPLAPPNIAGDIAAANCARLLPDSALNIGRSTELRLFERMPRGVGQVE